MPDLIMCSGVNCPLKETCYRFMAAPCERQSYFDESQYKDKKCEYHLPIKKKEDEK